MSLKLCCRFCGEEHKANKENFPESLMENKNQEVSPGVFKLVPVLVGHACKKCVNKRNKRAFMRAHGITADKSGRKSIAQQIRDKIKGMSSEVKK